MGAPYGSDSPPTMELEQSWRTPAWGWVAATFANDERTPAGSMLHDRGRAAGRQASVWEPIVGCPAAPIA